MKNKNKNLKWIFTLGTLTLLAFFVFAGIFYVKKNLENIVNYALTKGLNYNIQVGKVNISSLGKITATNVKLKDKKGKPVFDIPEVEIKYTIKDIMEGRYVNELWAKNPIVHLTIYEIKKLNIMDALNLYEPKKDTGKQSPLQYVKVSGGTLYYEDVSYKKPINIKIQKLDGFIDLKKKFNLFFEGNDFEDEKQYYSFGMEEYKEKKYEFKLSLENVEIRDELLQYAYDDLETITYKSGRADLNLTFGDKGVEARAFVNKGVLHYHFLKDDLKNLQASINFEKGNLEIFANAKLTKYPFNFKLNKKGTKLGIFFDSKNVDIKYILDNLPQKEFYKDLIGNVDVLEGQLVFNDFTKERAPLELFAKSKKISYLEHTLKEGKLNLDFNYDKMIFNIKNLECLYENIKNPEYFVNLKTKLKGVYENDKLKFDYAFTNLDSFIKNTNFNGKFVYDLKKEKIEVKNTDKKYPFDFFYDLKTTDISILGNFIESIDFTTEKLKNNLVSGNVDIKYNIKNAQVKKALGNLKISNDTFFKDMNISFENFGDEIFINELTGTRGDSSLKATGSINTKTMEYSAQVDEAIIKSIDFPYLKEISYLKDLPDFNLVTSFYIAGKGKEFIADINEAVLTTINSRMKAKGIINTKTMEYNVEVFEASINNKDFNFLEDAPNFYVNTNFNILGKDKEFKVNYTANIEKLEYGVLLNNTNFEGVLEYKNNEIFGNAEGYSKEAVYGDLKFKDLYLRLSFDNNKVIIDQILNTNLFVKGTYGINDGLLDLDYELKEYDLEKIKASKYNITGHISKMYGKIKDSLVNPTVSINLEKSFLNYNNTENAVVQGRLKLENHVINLQDFYLKENRVTGTVDLEKEILNLKANLLENNLNSYYKDNNAKYRVIGVVNVWGEYKDLRAVAQVNLDSIYYKGKKIPDLFLKLSYVNGDLNNIKNSGKINLTELRILGDNGFNLMEADGHLDLFTKEFKLKLGNENIAIKDIEYLVNDYKLSGKLNLSLEAEGNLDGKVDYNVNLKSTGLNYNNIVMDKINTKIKGNEKKLTVEYLEMNYGTNVLNAQGDFNIEKNTYDFSIKAKDVDLGILNLFLSQKVKDISGKADVDIILKTENSLGTLELKNAGLQSLDKSIILSNLNSKIELNIEGIKIKSFTGSLNNGTILLDGYLKIPKFTEELMVNPIASLKDYNLSIKLDDVDYRYEKTVLINVDTDLNFSNNLLTGDILINRGNIYKLPTVTKNEKETVIGFDANLEINTGEGIYFSADNIPLVEDIELKIEGGGILEIKNNRISFIGKMLSEDGALTFNNSIFAVSNGIIIFDGINEYFPKVNPSLAIKAQTKIASEEIYITISGYYNTLALDLQSSSGLSTLDITNLLLFKTSSNTSMNSFVKDILDKQFNEELFSPLSRELEKLLNISKVKFSSKILKLDDETLSLNPDILLGAELEIGNSLYKDSIFWNVKAQFSDEKSGEFIGGNAWLDYRSNKNLAWRLGIENDKKIENLNKPNYYLGIDFKYQMDSIFKNK